MNKERKEVPIRANRNYKDTLFRMIFREPDALLDLYNAINGTTYDDVTKLKVVTLENAIYMNMKNDVAFLIDCRLNLYEQQASLNPNMPLQNLFYVAREYQNLVDDKSLYASSVIKVPTPNFIVFYNGSSEQPERLEMRLSDLFETSVIEPALELKVTQLNIRIGHNKELMGKCSALKEYSQYVEKVKQYVGLMDLDKAVEQAVQECIREGILANFLAKNRAEAVSVSIFEYDEEKELALLRQAERETGGLVKLVSMVRKKKEKGLDSEEISQLFEEETRLIDNIWTLITRNPMADDEEIARIL